MAKATKAAAPRREPFAPMWFVYPFFAVHMLAFGVAGFAIAYGMDETDYAMLYMHGGIAIAIYMVFYVVIFGVDRVGWMLLNAGLGILGIYAQVGWILARFDKRIEDFPWQVHVVPFLYYVLYTFLLRQFLIDVTRSRDDPARRRIVEGTYVVLSLALYGVMLARSRGG